MWHSFTQTRLEWHGEEFLGNIKLVARGSDIRYDRSPGF